MDHSKSNSEETICSCNHLTHFAVLVDFSGSTKVVLLLLVLLLLVLLLLVLLLVLLLLVLLLLVLLLLVLLVLLLLVLLLLLLLSSPSLFLPCFQSITFFFFCF